MTEKKYNSKKQVQSDDNKLESTKESYIKISNGFLKRNLDDLDIARTPKNICDALFHWSKTVRSSTYNKMQCALEYHQYKLKHYKSAEKIRNTQRQGFGEISEIKKRTSCKHITEEEHQKLLSGCEAKNDKESKSAIILSYHLGLRPAEQTDIEYQLIDDNLLEVKIYSAKKGEDRSIDKELYLTLDESQIEAISNSVEALHCMTELKRFAMQKRVCRLSKKLFPRHKNAPTLYSYRHQLASDLKGGKTSAGNKIFSRKEASALMGHKSQSSISAYGHARNASKLKRDLPIPSDETIALVLDNSDKLDIDRLNNWKRENSSSNVNSKNEQKQESSQAEFLDQYQPEVKQQQSVETKKESRHNKNDDSEYSG